MSRFVLALLLAAVAACAPSRSADPPITVEGDVVFRGNEPFAAPWLETDMRSYYVLVLDEAQRAALATPARYRVTGRVYRDRWNGVPMAHLAVVTMRRVGG